MFIFSRIRGVVSIPLPAKCVKNQHNVELRNMSVLEWKRFNFFDLVQNVDQKKLQNVKAKIVAYCYNATQKVFCDALGYIHVYFKNWESISFQSHCSNIKLCSLTTEKNLLVIVSQNESLSETFVQIFNLNKITKRSGAPTLGNARLITSSDAKVIRSCLLDNVHLCIAIGFEKGDILLHRAVVARDMSANFRCLNVCNKAITGIEFRRQGTIDMFVCSNAGVFCYTITENNIVSETRIILDSKVSPARSCTLGPPPHYYFLVGRDDAVYCFTNEGRGPCYAIEGKKKLIAWFSNNLISVIHEETKGYLPRDSTEVIVVDLNNNLIVFDKEMPLINCVIVDSSSCFVVTSENEVHQLQERELESKIQLLVGRSLYDIALRLLAEDDFCESRGHVLMQYGDYLLQRGDPGGAVEKYVQTVGLVEPYCIVSKLLDTKYSTYLAQYLRVLVQTPFASAEHKELLVHCDDRLNLPSKIDHICRDKEDLFNAPVGCAENRIFPNKDTYTFLNMFRSGQTQDDIICKFLAQLEEDKIYNLFMENSQLLMTHHPRQTTNVLMKVCTKAKSSETALFTSPRRFIPLLVSYEAYCIEFLEYLTIAAEADVETYNFLLEMYLREWQRGERTDENVIHFMKNHMNNFSLNQLLIFCKSYGFWEGLLYLLKTLKQEQLYMQHYIKTGNFETILQNDDGEEILDRSLLLQAFNKKSFKADSAAGLINSLLKATFREKRLSVLQVLQGISINQKLTVMHIKEFFGDEKAGSAVTHFIEPSIILKPVRNDQQRNKDLISCFMLNPIEFRSSMCDICKQQLKLPAVYYLCQHCFHKECINSYSDQNSCIACMTVRKQDGLTSCENDGPWKGTKDCDLHVNAIEYVSTLICSELFKNDINVAMKANVKESQSNINTLRIEQNRNDNKFNNTWAKNTSEVHTTSKKMSTNPFDDDETTPPKTKEYDSNLNPFSE